MQQALWSSVTASVVLAGAGVIGVTPVQTPSILDIKMPAVQLTGFEDLSGDGLGLAGAASPGESIAQMLIAAIQQSETNFADSFQSGAQALGTQLSDFGAQLDAMGTNLTDMGGAIDPILGAIYTDLGTFYGADDLGGLVQLSGTIIPFLAQPLYDIEIQEVNLGAALFDLLTGTAPSTGAAADWSSSLGSFGDLNLDGLGDATAGASPGESIAQMLIAAIQQSETNFADSFQSGAQALGTQISDFGAQLDAMGTNLTDMGGAIDPILGAIYTDLGTFYGADDLGGLVQLSGTIIPFLAQPLYDIEIQEVNLGAALFDLFTGTATGAGAAADVAPDMSTGVSSLIADLSAIF